MSQRGKNEAKSISSKIEWGKGHWRFKKGGKHVNERPRRIRRLEKHRRNIRTSLMYPTFSGNVFK